MMGIMTTTTTIMIMMTMIRPYFADLQVLQDGPALRILCLGSPRKPNIYSWICDLQRDMMSKTRRKPIG